MCKSLKICVPFVILSFVLAACGSPAPAPTEAPAQPANIEGSYTVAGTNPDGSTYESTLDVAASGEAYNWVWNDGEYKGVALKQDNTVSVAWGDDACYVVSYTIGDDGVLTGRWTDMAISGIGGDIATPTEGKAAGLEGLYGAVGTNPDGSTYGCSLQVTRMAEGVYEWYWSNCGEYTGVGIQDGNVISVAYGTDSCSAMSYHIQDDGTLKANWAYVGQSDLGTETLTRK